MATSKIPHEKLVWHVIHTRFKGFTRQDEQEELFAAGLLGLAKALKRFDPDKGFEISSYACPYIYGEIQHYLRDSGLKPRVPAFYRDVYIRNRLRSDYEACEKEGISLDQWREIRQACEVSMIDLEKVHETPASDPDLDEELPVLDEAVTVITGWLESLSQIERDAVHRCLLDGQPFYKDLKLIRSAVAKLG